MTDNYDLGAMVDHQFRLLQDLRATPEGFTVDNLRRVVQPVYDAFPRDPLLEVQYPYDLQGTETGNHLRELVAYVRLEDTGYEFGFRALRAVERTDAHYVGQVAAIPRQDLRKVRGLGTKGLSQIDYFLDTLGLQLDTDLGLTYPMETTRVQP